MLHYETIKEVQKRVTTISGRPLCYIKQRAYRKYRPVGSRLKFCLIFFYFCNLGRTTNYLSSKRNHGCKVFLDNVVLVEVAILCIDHSSFLKFPHRHRHGLLESGIHGPPGPRAGRSQMVRDLKKKMLFWFVDPCSGESFEHRDLQINFNSPLSIHRLNCNFTSL